MIYCFSSAPAMKIKHCFRFADDTIEAVQSYDKKMRIIHFCIKMIRIERDTNCN